METRVEVDGQIVDTSSVATGLRILRLDPLRGLRVNGVSVKLRGACIHHTNGILGACTFARAEERRVEQLKAAGFNAIRSSHNPMSRSMLEACDRLGMYVMEESFDQWNKSKTAYDYALHFNEWWERDLEALVAKDYNHPCVVMYSIGNEICELFERDSVELNRKMADKLRAMDPTRYVTNCINGMLCIMDEVQEMVAEQLSKTKKLASEINEAMNSMSRNEMREMVALNPRMTAKLAEPCASLDITGYNYMADRCEVDRECTPNRVIVGSETFPKDIAHNWAYVKKYPNVIGDFTWTGLDYLGEAGIARHDYDGPGAFAGAYPYCSGGCGDIDLAGQRLPISYYREIVFGLRRDPYIAVQRPERYGQKHYTSVWGWSDSMESWTWPGFENKPIIAEVYAAADEVEIYVNGVSQGRKPIGESHNYKAEFETQYIPGEILAVAYTDGVETGRFSIKTASKPAALLAVPDRIVLKDDTQDICHISLCIADSNGLCNPADDREISVRVEGSGVLQGFGNANPLDAADYTQSRCRTYRGHALAAVRPTSPGEIRVILEADGLPTVEVSLNVESEITA